MTQIHYKSDFDFIFELEGGFPTFNFGGKITSGVSEAVYFTFNCINKKCKNCFNDNGKIHVVCDKHGLPPGKLMLELYAYLPNSLYPDGERTIVCKTPIDIELTRSGCTEPIETPQIEVVIPYAVIDAYRLAVANGFQGSQEEFYTSLNSLSASNEYSDERAVVHRFTAQTANGGKYAVHIGCPDLIIDINQYGQFLLSYPASNENLPTSLIEPNKEIGLHQPITNMAGMFAYIPPFEVPIDIQAMIGKERIVSEPIVSIDVSQLNTTGVTNMDGMFIGYAGTELDLSSFDVSSVTRIGGAFLLAENLETINFSGWQLDVNNIENSLDEVAIGFVFAPIKTFIMRDCNPEFIEVAQVLNESYFNGEINIITD